MLGVYLLNLQVIPIQHNMYHQLCAFKVVLKTFGHKIVVHQTESLKAFQVFSMEPFCLFHLVIPPVLSVFYHK